MSGGTRKPDRQDDGSPAVLTFPPPESGEALRRIWMIRHNVPSPPAAGGPAGCPDAQALAAYAARVLWARTERSRFFDTDLFGDAAWDMLLGLYVLGSGRSPVSTARLMELIEIPRSAVLRWRKYLQDRDLIARSAHVGGARGQCLELTEPARHALDNYFSRVCGPRP